MSSERAQLDSEVSPPTISYCSSSRADCKLQAAVSNLRPRSLLYERQTDRPAEATTQSVWARALLRIGGFYNKESQLLRAAKCLNESVLEQGSDSALYEGMPTWKSISETIVRPRVRKIMHFAATFLGAFGSVGLPLQAEQS